MENKKSQTTLQLFDFCRGDRIRTCDHLVPNQVHYRTVLHPVAIAVFLNCECKGSTLF